MTCQDPIYCGHVGICAACRAEAEAPPQTRGSTAHERCVEVQEKVSPASAGTEFWRTLQPGDRVVLCATGQPGKSEPEEVHGLHGTFEKISPTHGYARVRFDTIGHYLVHPESLQPEVKP